MIAKVKIAPLEHWCEFYASGQYGQPTPGMEIEILTNSMRIDPPDLDLSGHPPGSNWWAVSEDWMLKNRTNPRRRWVCEHLLEMD